jgi:hypothetical protein
VAAALILANVPGQLVVAPDGDEMDYFPRVGASPLLEHGWPFVYLRRGADLPSRNVTAITAPVWPTFDDLVEVRWPPLLANLLVGVLILAASVVLFQIWRRRRTALWRFSLRELLVFVVVVGVVSYVVHAERKAHFKEARTLQKMSRDARYRRLQPAGPTWLRAAAGEKPFDEFDFVVQMWAEGHDLEHAAKLQRLKYLDVDDYSKATNRQLAWLADCPSLEELSMSGLELEPGDDHIRLTPMDKLRGLSMQHTTFRGNGLEKLTKLRRLDLSDTEVDDDVLAKLEKMPHLAELSLESTKVTNAGMPRLAKLTTLQELHLANLPIDDAGFAHLATLGELRVLYLSRSISDAARIDLQKSHPKAAIWRN